jgi:hypothetical protein
MQKAFDDLEPGAQELVSQAFEYLQSPAARGFLERLGRELNLEKSGAGV